MDLSRIVHYIINDLLVNTYTREVGYKKTGAAEELCITVYRHLSVSVTVTSNIFQHDVFLTKGQEKQFVSLCSMISPLRLNVVKNINEHLYNSCSFKNE
jgi:hypothetical protein